MRNVTVRSSIGWAYEVQDFQVVGDLNADRFDIAAKAAAPSPAPMMREMLTKLLAERFNLKFHRERKQLVALNLVVAKGGSKLRVSSEDGPGILTPTKAAMVAQHATMFEFAAKLSGPLRTPVVDKTGLTGRYDFTVDLVSYFGNVKPGEQPDIAGIVMSALREQVGLGLESRKEPVEILVIDHVEKPIGN
jgi:uncharacterized protein (TIGR03435 family)